MKTTLMNVVFVMAQALLHHIVIVKETLEMSVESVTELVLIMMEDFALVMVRDQIVLENVEEIVQVLMNVEFVEDQVS